MNISQWKNGDRTFFSLEVDDRLLVTNISNILVCCFVWNFILKPKTQNTTAKETFHFSLFFCLFSFSLASYFNILSQFHLIFTTIPTNSVPAPGYNLYKPSVLLPEPVCEVGLLCRLQPRTVRLDAAVAAAEPRQEPRPHHAPHLALRPRPHAPHHGHEPGHAGGGAAADRAQQEGPRRLPPRHHCHEIRGPVPG